MNTLHSQDLIALAAVIVFEGVEVGQKWGNAKQCFCAAIARNPHPSLSHKAETELSPRNSWTFSDQSTDLQAQQRTQWCFELILVYY